MRLGELILLEAKDEYVVKAFGPKIVQVAQIRPWYTGSGFITRKDPQEEISAEEINAAALIFVREKLVPLDPTPNKKYLVWIAKLYSDGKLKEEDFYKVPEALTLFNKVQPRLAQKDIMQYKSLQDLFRALEPFENEEAQKSGREKRKEERAEAIQGADLVYDTADFKIYRINTKAAACELGRGTKWCTASTQSENYFSHYDADGTLYALIPTNLRGDAPYQLFFPHSDAKDSTMFEAANKFDDGVTIRDLIGVFPSAKPMILELFGYHKSPITYHFSEIYSEQEIKSLPVECRLSIVEDLFDDYYGYGTSNAKILNQKLNASFTPKELKTLLAHPKITNFIASDLVDAPTPTTALKKAAKFYGSTENVLKVTRNFTEEQYQEIFTSFIGMGTELPPKAQLNKLLEFTGKTRKEFLNYIIASKAFDIMLFRWMLSPGTTLEKELVKELTQQDRMNIIEESREHSLYSLLGKMQTVDSFKTLTPKEVKKLTDIVIDTYKLRKHRLPKDTDRIKGLPNLRDLNEIHIRLTGTKININIEQPKLTRQQKADGQLIKAFAHPDHEHNGIDWYEVNNDSLIRAIGNHLPWTKDVLEVAYSTGFLTARPNGYMLFVVSQGILKQAWLTMIPYGKEDARSVSANTGHTRLYSYENITLNDKNLKAALDKLIDVARDDRADKIEIDTTDFRESKQ